VRRVDRPEIYLFPPTVTSRVGASVNVSRSVSQSVTLSVSRLVDRPGTVMLRQLEHGLDWMIGCP